MFQSYEAKNGQRFQNDALRHINPVKIAITEAASLWPDSSQLDYLVTMGTGYTDQHTKPTGAPESEPTWWQRFLESFNNYFDTEIIWEQYKPSIDPEQIDRYHRFNVLLSRHSFADRDKTSSINSLEIATCEAFNRGKPSRLKLRETANSLIAALFYARIESISKTSERTYDVNAVLVCRLEQRYHAKVMTELVGRNACFLVNARKAEITTSLLDSVRKGGYCRIPIDYTVMSFADKTEIYLVLDAVTSSNQRDVGYHISGSPFSLEKASSGLKCRGNVADDFANISV